MKEIQRQVQPEKESDFHQIILIFLREYKLTFKINVHTYTYVCISYHRVNIFFLCNLIRRVFAFLMDVTWKDTCFSTSSFYFHFFFFGFGFILFFSFPSILLKKKKKKKVGILIRTVGSVHLKFTHAGIHYCHMPRLKIDYTKNASFNNNPRLTILVKNQRN